MGLDPSEVRTSVGTAEETFWVSLGESCGLFRNVPLGPERTLASPTFSTSPISCSSCLHVVLKCPMTRVNRQTGRKYFKRIDGCISRVLQEHSLRSLIKLRLV